MYSDNPGLSATRQPGDREGALTGAANTRSPWAGATKRSSSARDEASTAKAVIKRLGAPGPGPRPISLGSERGITDISDKPRARQLSPDFRGHLSYVVVAATYAYERDGKHIVETGSIYTLALQKVAGRWRITGWT